MAVDVERMSFGRNARLRTDNDRCSPTTSRKVWPYPMGGQRHLHTRVGQDEEAAEDRDDTDHAELLGDHGEDEVAVCQRQEVAELVLPLANSLARQPTLGKCDHRLVGLIAEVILVGGD